MNGTKSKGFFAWFVNWFNRRSFVISTRMKNCSQLLLQRVVPFLFHEQLAVRSSAIEVVSFVVSNGEFSSSIVLRSRLLDDTLRVLSSPSVSVREAEGALALCTSISAIGVQLFTNAKLQEARQRLARHEAATVRQLYADVVSIPRAGGIQDSICDLQKLTLNTTSSPDVIRSAETFMMALNQQLFGFCSAFPTSSSKSETLPSQSGNHNVTPGSPTGRNDPLRFLRFLQGASGFTQPF